MELVAYKRPQAQARPPKSERDALLREYFEHYRELSLADPAAFNRKVPRAAFSGLLDRIGNLLLQEARRAAAEEGAVRDFLAQNALPGRWGDLLSDEFRAFCLALNALKQWTAAESAATDRYVLGGNARAELRLVAQHCLVTGELLGSDSELHHPLRDGRPPLPLSKRGHARIEGQHQPSEGDPRAATLNGLRSESNRSWAMLRRGCLDLLEQPVSHSSTKARASARAFAQKARERSGMTFSEIIAWLDERSR